MLQTRFLVVIAPCSPKLYIDNKSTSGQCWEPGWPGYGDVSQTQACGGRFIGALDGWMQSAGVHMSNASHRLFPGHGLADHAGKVRLGLYSNCGTPFHATTPPPTPFAAVDSPHCTTEHAVSSQVRLDPVHYGRQLSARSNLPA